MMKKLLKKTIVIMGPTASGKSDLAIALARKYDGEIISADSRQVYRGMDIGTGKVSKAEQKLAQHWLIDVASPKRTYNVTHFVRDAKKAILAIKKRGKMPIICGGTGFWIQTLLEDNPFPSVKPNSKLRKGLGKLSASELFQKLQRTDPKRAKTIDSHNKVRLIRAIEICASLGKVPILPNDYKLKAANYTIIALCPAQKILYQNIGKRLEKRLRKGMVAEVKKLREEGLSWKRLESFGLEYKYVALLLQRKITKEVMKERLNFEIRHYAKRQITWLRRLEKMGAKIHFISEPQKGVKMLEEKSLLI